MPPPLIQIKNDTKNQRADVIDEIRVLALRGHEIFSEIYDKINALPCDGESDSILQQQLQKEHNIFKGKVEEVQLKLTSPTLESKKLKEFSQEGTPKICITHRVTVNFLTLMCRSGKFNLASGGPNGPIEKDHGGDGRSLEFATDWLKSKAR